MQGPGHGTAVSKLATQSGIYVDDRNDVAGVLPQLGVGGGFASTGDGNGIKDPDGGIFVGGDPDGRRHRFMFEVDVENNSPTGIARRAVYLFRRYELLRNLVQVKIYRRRVPRREGPGAVADDGLGRLPAVCWFLRRGDDDVVHVKCVFEMGTARNSVWRTSKRTIRDIWDHANFELDFGIACVDADGINSIRIEPYPNNDLDDVVLFLLFSTPTSSNI